MPNEIKMATLEALGPEIEDFIRQKIQLEHKTHAEVVRQLRSLYPSISRGISTKSVSRFCSSHCIHRTSRLSEEAVDRLVYFNTTKVCLCLLAYCID